MLSIESMAGELYAAYWRELAVSAITQAGQAPPLDPPAWRELGAADRAGWLAAAERARELILSEATAWLRS
jgi:hypothetical protein